MLTGEAIAITDAQLEHILSTSAKELLAGNPRSSPVSHSRRQKWSTWHSARHQRSPFQLRIGPNSLNNHLDRIKRADSPKCPHCSNVNEDTAHVLLRCWKYATHRHLLTLTLKHKAYSLQHLPSNRWRGRALCRSNQCRRPLRWR